MRWWSTAKWLILLTLVTMVFIRLVWMNLRVYNIQPDPRALTTLVDIQKTGTACSPDNALLSAGKLQFVGERVSEGLSSWQNSILYRQYMALSCKNGFFSSQTYMRNNQTLLLLIIFICILIVRLFCRSWQFVFIVAAVLLSRGRLMSVNEHLSGINLMMFFCSLWALCLFHFLRSGSLLSFVLSLVVICLLVELEPVSFALFFVLPILMFLGYSARFRVISAAISRVRFDRSRARRLLGQEVSDFDERFSGRRRLYHGIRSLITGQSGAKTDSIEKTQGDIFFRVRLLKPLKVPFSLWAYHRHRWLIFALVQLGVALISLAVIFWYMSDHSWYLSRNNLILSEWLMSVVGRFDLDITVGLFLLVFVLSIKPAEGLLSFWEAAWFFSVSYVFLLIFAFVWDRLNEIVFYDNEVLLWRGPQVVLWFEPVFLTVTLLSLYHTVIVIDRRVFG